MTQLPQPKSLQDLVQEASLGAAVDGDRTTTVTGMSFDSRAVAPGDLFFCVPGATADGHRFASDAAAAGAAALCIERAVDANLPAIRVEDVRAAMPVLAAAGLGQPARAMTMLGVTGTNGKTTTAFLIESVMRAAGRTTGLVGTIETRIGNERQPGIRTTPESLDLQALLARMVASGVDAVAMEVTSHALVLNRVDGIVFDAAAFTNLTQDHLDFHRGMEDYFAAKMSLFTPQRARRAVVNIDDPYGQRIARDTEIETITFGVSGAAALKAEDVELGPSGSTFTLVCDDGSIKIPTSLVGPFNISNCLAAAGIAWSVGVSLDDIAAGIAALSAVPGRFEAVDEGQRFTVVVDYAHTPDSLDNVLRAARHLAAPRSGRVIVVFGAGGDRDRGKRPLMGMVAARGADVVVVTSDNPRSEVPESIVGQIVEGVQTEKIEGPDASIVDRRAAIRHAIGMAGDDDVVVIAGKGHETGQQFADHTIPFDDRIVARDILAELGYGAGA